MGLCLRMRFLDEYAMNGFDVNAVGWVLTLNAHGLSQQERRELYGLWTGLLCAYTEDKNKVHPILRLTIPRSIKLSEKSMGAFSKLVDRMIALNPERFGCDGLRGRRNGWVLQMALGFLSCFLAANFLPITFPLFGEIVLTLFVMSFACLAPTVTLWRAASAVKCLSARTQLAAQSMRG